jgi:hypothetical protein
MSELVYVVAIVGVVAIVAIVFDRGFRGKAGPEGAQMEVTPGHDPAPAAPTTKPAVTGKKRVHRK